MALSRFARFILALTIPMMHACSNPPTRIHTDDVLRFWSAYDSVMNSSHEEKQIQLIQALYINKASAGLKEFIKARDFTAAEWLKNMKSAPRFWKSIRPKTLSILPQTKAIENIMERFRQLYPDFHQPEVYFTIGCLRSGGTTSAQKILIGTEIAAADSSVDASEVGEWLHGVFKVNTGILQLVAHECVHTQQSAEGEESLLASCLKEGSADFVAELLLQKPYAAAYMAYGQAHEKELFEKFEKEKDGTDIKDWLYNGGNKPGGQGDLGYFMGYAICTCFYTHAPDKNAALKQILTINYLDNKASEAFYRKSGYREKVLKGL